jgi:hypothetical protein
MITEDPPGDPIEPASGFLAFGDLLEPPPSDEKRLGCHIGCVLGRCSSAECISEDALVVRFVKLSEPVALPTSRAFWHIPHIWAP